MPEVEPPEMESEADAEMLIESEAETVRSSEAETEMDEDAETAAQWLVEYDRGETAILIAPPETVEADQQHHERILPILNNLLMGMEDWRWETEAKAEAADTSTKEAEAAEGSSQTKTVYAYVSPHCAIVGVQPTCC